MPLTAAAPAIKAGDAEKTPRKPELTARMVRLRPDAGEELDRACLGRVAGGLVKGTALVAVETVNIASASGCAF
jgi:hypothetical protein